MTTCIHDAVFEHSGHHFSTRYVHLLNHGNMSFQTKTRLHDLGGGGGGLAMILLSRACNYSHWSLLIA